MKYKKTYKNVNKREKTKYILDGLFSVFLLIFCLYLIYQVGYKKLITANPLYEWKFYDLFLHGNFMGWVTVCYCIKGIINFIKNRDVLKNCAEKKADKRDNDTDK